MKIVAYSKIPSATPFVHLGYLAASRTIVKPIQGLALSGMLILIAAFSIASERLLHGRKSPEPAGLAGRHLPTSALIGLALLLLASAIVWSAYAFGEKNRVYAYPEEATSGRIWEFGQTVAHFAKPDNDANPAVKLPTHEGEYELFSVFKQPVRPRERFMDGWNTPLMLRVIRREGGLEYVVVSAGPDRTLGTQDDVTSKGEE